MSCIVSRTRIAEWVETNGEADVVYAFLRRDAAGGCVLCALNLSGKALERTFEVKGITSAEVLIDTDWERYGGSTPDAEGLAFPRDAGGVPVSISARSGRLITLGSPASASRNAQNATS